MSRFPLAALLLLASAAHAGEMGLTISRPAGHIAHIFPTVQRALALNLPADAGPLLYHPGGSIMPTATITPIFWVPPTLQDGSATSMSADYQEVQIHLASRYPGHGLANNNTQYYQIIGKVTTFIRNAGGYAGSYIDTSAYPTGGCIALGSTLANCITDAQIQMEITKIITTNALKNNLTRIFLLYTSAGENMCFNSNQCSYTLFCAYHSYYQLGANPVIYGAEPYGGCPTAQPSPNNDPDADTAAAVASHEITEAITDPLLNAWFTATGYEIGDLCAYNYGTNTWTSNQGIAANQFWSGAAYAFFELQQEFDNHVGGCVQIGP